MHCPSGSFRDDWEDFHCSTTLALRDLVCVRAWVRVCVRVHGRIVGVYWHCVCLLLFPLGWAHALMTLIFLMAL